MIDQIKGTSEASFQVDAVLDGPRIKNESGAMAVRNSDDNAYAKLKLLAGTEDDEAITLKQFKTTKLFEFIAAQADCSTAIPSNTGTKRVLVVTTAGNGAVIGDLLYDNGSGSGTMEIIPRQARTIHIPIAFSGGTITFDPDSLYSWDEEGLSWIKVGDIGSVTGALRSLRYAIGTATADSVSDIPANAIVWESRLHILVPYNAGTTISIGKVGGSASLLMTTSENKPQKAENWRKPQETSWGAGSAKARTTITGASSGSGFVSVIYSAPNA